MWIAERMQYQDLQNRSDLHSHGYSERLRPRNTLPFFSTTPFTMDYSGYYNQGYSGSGSGDVNPYHQPYQGPMYPIPGSSGSSHQAPVPANAYEYDVGILAQQSVYVPGAMIDKRGGAGGKLAKGGKRTTVLRKGAGKVWEDQTLLEWNPCASDHAISAFDAH